MSRLRRFLGRTSRLVVVSTVGFALLIAGIVLSLPGVPGPGILVAIAGLAVLSTEFVWARRLRSALGRRFTRLRRRAFGSGDDDDNDRTLEHA